MKKVQIATFVLSFISLSVFGQENINKNKFRQLGQELPTPNVYRTASGSPGHMYWRQQADYIMDIRLDDENQRVYGEEVINYSNNSPDALEYLWIQLDQNVRHPESQTHKIETGKIDDGMGLYEFA